MSTLYTIKEISKITGLKEQFIRKCIMESKGQFDKYIVSRGKNNSINFDSNALVLFDKIKQKKEDGLVIPDILPWLFQGIQSEISIKTENNDENNQEVKNIFKSFEQMHKEVIQAKDETIKTKDEHIKALESKIMLLTDGRDPQVVKAEHEKKQEDLIKLKQNLEIKDQMLEENKNKLHLLEKESKEESIKQISLIQEKDSQLFELQRTYNSNLERENKKNEILKELESLEGKWLVGSKRKSLLNKLKELSL